MLFAMKNEAATVAYHWSAILGIFEILQSNNGTEFKGICLELMRRYGVKANGDVTADGDFTADGFTADGVEADGAAVGRKGGRQGGNTEGSKGGHRGSKK